jgi:hypothetical protein
MLTDKEYTTLLDQYGLTRRESANPTETLQEKTMHNQNDMGVVGSSRVSEHTPAERLNSYSPEEQKVYSIVLNQLKQDGGSSPEEMERLARKAVEEWRSSSEPPF